MWSPLPMVGDSQVHDAGRHIFGHQRVFPFSVSYRPDPDVDLASVCEWVGTGKTSLGGAPYMRDKRPREEHDSTPEAAKKETATRLDELNKIRGKQVFHDLERGPENKP